MKEPCRTCGTMTETAAHREGLDIVIPICSIPCLATFNAITSMDLDADLRTIEYHGGVVAIETEPPEYAGRFDD